MFAVDGCRTERAEATMDQRIPPSATLLLVQRAPLEIGTAPLARSLGSLALNPTVRHIPPV